MGTNRSAARRLAAKFREEEANPPPLPVEHQELLANYRPALAADADWEAVSPVLEAVMRRARLVGTASFAKHLGVVSSYLLWRHRTAAGLDVKAAFTFAEIDRYFLDGLDGMSQRTRQDYRSRLRNVASSVNPGLDAPPRVVAGRHHSIKPGYSPAEEVSIRRAALGQRREVSRRRLCAIVGLAAGAGLDPNDLRHLRGRDVEDTGDGIVVRVSGNRPRVTVVRVPYEEVVRAGIDGLRPGDLVVGQKVDRHNAMSNAIDKADLFDDVPEIDTARLRSTWLSWLLTRPVPLQVILAASGLQSARSLTDLLPHLPEPVVDLGLLRDGEVQR